MADEYVYRVTRKKKLSFNRGWRVNHKICSRKGLNAMVMAERNSREFTENYNSRHGAPIEQPVQILKIERAPAEWENVTAEELDRADGR